MGTNWTQKLITLSVLLGTSPGTNQPPALNTGGTGISVGLNTNTISGLRTSVRIRDSGYFIETATVKVWGLTPSQQNQYNTLGMVYNIMPRNTLTISAGDAVNGMSAVTSGTIFDASPDYRAMPDVPFTFECNSILASAIAPAPAASFSGTVSVASVLAGMARQIKLGFQNAGVSATLTNAYYPGTIKQQIEAVCEHAGVSPAIISGTLWIWPRGGSRGAAGLTTPIVSPATGMIGYPRTTPQGIVVDTVFNPQIAVGGLIQVQSSLLAGLSVPGATTTSFTPPANGVWSVYKLDLALDSMVRNGQWMSTAYCYNPNFSRPFPS